jgi:outer membrane protein OmpA-like peptidoglycan-associated protein
VDGSVSRPIVDRLHLSLKEMDRYAHTIHAALQHSVHETNRTFDSAARRYVDRALKPIDQRIATLTQQLRTLRERNSSDPQMTKSLRALSADVAALRDQMRRWHTRTQPPPKPSQPTTAQLRRSAVKKLANAFAGTPGFDPETGALDCIQKPLFARGGVAVLPRARSYLDGELRRYITTLLDDPAIRAHLRAIVIEGHTDRTGDAKINRQISWQRASAVVQHLLELDWGAAYGLEHYLRPQAAHRYEPVIIEGAEKTDASRRIRIRFELDAEPPAQLPRKELP